MKVPILRKRPLASVGVVVILSFLQSCVIVDSTRTKPAPDTSTITGSIAHEQAPANADNTLADQKIIRNRIATASLAQINNTTAGGETDTGLHWVNDQTGTRGTITNLREASENGQLCRKFTTTREAFDGIMVYSGKACEVSNGIWTLSQFSAQ